MCAARAGVLTASCCLTSAASRALSALAAAHAVQSLTMAVDMTVSRECSLHGQSMPAGARVGGLADRGMG